MNFSKARLFHAKFLVVVLGEGPGAGVAAIDGRLKR
jgi:hypothetical protein